MPLLSGTPTGARSISLTTTARDVRSRAVSFETLGRFNPGAMQFLCKATDAAFPELGHQRSTCFANVYHQLSVVQCRCLSHMLTVAAGLHTARTGSGWIRDAPQPSPEVLHKACGRCRGCGRLCLVGLVCRLLSSFPSSLVLSVPCSLLYPVQRWHPVVEFLVPLLGS
jgi:hypothetical protein